MKVRVSGFGEDDAAALGACVGGGLVLREENQVQLQDLVGPAQLLP
ncbi:hypothetical protein [Nonomuraea basaltis]|nr:hypothetical protein [Nonomuraea basaltis]